MNPHPLSMVGNALLAWKHQILTFASVLDYGSSLVAQTINYLPAVQETWVQSLGQEETLEKGLAGDPLQCPCLENPTDRGAWRATVPGIAKSQTRVSDQHF